MERFYFIELGFRWYVDLCIVEWISKDDFQHILIERNEERENESKLDWVHAEWYYDWLSWRVEKQWWRLICVKDTDVILDY